MNNNFKVRCPKCGSEMDYIIEKEKLGNGDVRIRTYYRCPVCGTIIIDQKIAVKRVNGHIRALIEEPKQVIVRRKSTKKVSITKKLKALGFMK